MRLLTKKWQSKGKISPFFPTGPHVLQQCYILHARKMIPINWMKPNPLRFVQKMAAILQLGLPIFKKRWTPGTLYLDLNGFCLNQTK